MKGNVIKEKSFQFAIRIVNLFRHLTKEQNEFILSKQVMRSGTSVGAIVREAEHAESKRDFIHKLSIGLKEANESDYWLDLLFATSFINEKMYVSMKKDCGELLKLLAASVKTSKSRLRKNTV